MSVAEIWVGFFQSIHGAAAESAESFPRSVKHYLAKRTHRCVLGCVLLSVLPFLDEVLYINTIQRMSSRISMIILRV